MVARLRSTYHCAFFLSQFDKHVPSGASSLHPSYTCFLHEYAFTICFFLSSFFYCLMIWEYLPPSCFCAAPPLVKSIWEKSIDSVEPPSAPPSFFISPNCSAINSYSRWEWPSLSYLLDYCFMFWINLDLSFSSIHSRNIFSSLFSSAQRVLVIFLKVISWSSAYLSADILRAILYKMTLLAHSVHGFTSSYLAFKSKCLNSCSQKKRVKR